MNNLYVLLPCYNEAGNIEALIDSWGKVGYTLNSKGISVVKLVLVDDGSSDATLSILHKYCDENANNVVLEHTKNMGLGAAIKTGIAYIINESNDNDYACIMDADNTHDPAYIKDMIDLLISRSVDCIIASRYKDGSKVVGVPVLREFISIGAKFFFKLVLPIPNVTDYTCGYRLYKTCILKKAYNMYRDNIISEKGFTCMVELLYRVHKVGAYILETPFILRYDKKIGVSKMKVMKTAFKSIVVAFRIRINS